MTSNARKRRLFASLPRDERKYADFPDGWQHTPRDNLIACCDCSLVHRIQFRFRSSDGAPLVEWRMDRDNRATAQLRRHKKRK